jgi:hypothetical protein
VVLGEGGFVSGLLLCDICFMIRLNMGLCVRTYCSFVVFCTEIVYVKAFPCI